MWRSCEEPLSAHFRKAGFLQVEFTDDFWWRDTFTVRKQLISGFVGENYEDLRRTDTAGNSAVYFRAIRMLLNK
jgi:hypothetical protein